MPFENGDADDWFRRATAERAAHSFLIMMLMRLALRDLSADGARLLGDEIKRQASDTTHLTGMTAGDEAASERMADVALQMQDHVAFLVDNTIQAVVSALRGQGE